MERTVRIGIVFYNRLINMPLNAKLRKHPSRGGLIVCDLSDENPKGTRVRVTSFLSFLSVVFHSTEVACIGNLTHINTI